VDFSEFLFALLLYGPLTLPLLYVLTILLRVVCHFNGVEIPGLGRAFFTTAAAAFFSVIAAYLLQRGLVGFESYQPSPTRQFLVIALALVANLGITASLYRLLLGVKFGQALSLWLFQAGLFGMLLLTVGCCGGLLVFVVNRL
jgi:hypothetical protein